MIDLVAQLRDAVRFSRAVGRGWYCDFGDGSIIHQAADCIEKLHDLLTAANARADEIDEQNKAWSKLVDADTRRIAELEERERAYIHDLSAKEAQIAEANARADAAEVKGYERGWNEALASLVKSLEDKP